MRSAVFAFQRRDNEQMRGCVIDPPQRNRMIGNFFQSRSQPFRISGQKRSGSVGEKFSLRDIASWISVAAIGARMAKIIPTIIIIS